MSDSRCIGCGGEFPDIDGPTHRYMISSPGCWALYGEVLAREYSDAAYMGVHRLSVDSYAVQHPGEPSRQSIHSVGVHLVRLSLFLEHNLSSENANTAMLAAARQKQNFRWLDPPQARGVLTIVDVVKAESGREHHNLVNQWARGAWQAWADHHETIKHWLSLSGADKVGKR